MVRRGDVLETELAREADGPYEAQPIARKAPEARRRLLALLGLGAAALAIEAAFAGGGWPLAALAFVGLAAWLVHRGRLAGLVAAAFAALLAIGVPLAQARLMGADAGAWLRVALSVGLGLAALPNLLTLTRDAELQYAYGLWARRADK